MKNEHVALNDLTNTVGTMTMQDGTREHQERCAAEYEHIAEELDAESDCTHDTHLQQALWTSAEYFRTRASRLRLSIGVQKLGEGS